LARDLPPPHTHTLSLHDALPICLGRTLLRQELRADLRLDLGRDLGVLDQKLAGVLLALADTLAAVAVPRARFLDDVLADADVDEDRKSTRLNSSHVKISYAVFCL